MRPQQKLAAVALKFFDAVEIWSIFSQGLFFLTPIFYPIDAVPVERAFLIRCNPVYYLLEVFRSPLYNGSLAPKGTIITAVIIGIATFIVGWWAFSRNVKQMPYLV